MPRETMSLGDPPLLPFLVFAVYLAGGGRRRAYRSHLGRPGLRAAAKALSPFHG
ncbi:MAG: hypothetical protein JOZ15_14300 [Acidobacteria bacterium]|nr:hypothetical protein [Acidobacteriota bacterium]